MKYTQSKLDYRNNTDVLELADQLWNSPHTPQLCAFIVDNGLMKAQWWLQLMFWASKKRHGSSLPVWRELNNQDPEHIRSFMLSTVHHILLGKDLTTTDAVGGFNQEEIDILSAELYRIRS